MIKAIICDLDGCLTDGGMYYTSIGEPSTDFYFNPYFMMGLFAKKFHTRDAAAARWLHENTDVKLFVVTAGDHPRNNAINKARMEIMYLTDPIYQGVEDKLGLIADVLSEYNIDPEETAYIGDDRIDLEILMAVGFSGCSADALESVRAVARWQSNVNGGQGVLADLIDRWRNAHHIQEKRK